MSLRPVRLRAMAAALMFLAPTLGCSWIFVNKPPPGPIEATPPLECTSSGGAPAADTIGAVAFGLTGIGLTIFGASASSSPCEGFDLFCYSPQQRAAIIAAGVALMGATVALGFSAAYGNSATTECDVLRVAQLSCTSGVEEACRTLQERKPK